MTGGSGCRTYWWRGMSVQRPDAGPTRAVSEPRRSPVLLGRRVWRASMRRIDVAASKAASSPRRTAL